MKKFYEAMSVHMVGEISEIINKSGNVRHIGKRRKPIKKKQRRW